MTVRVHNSRVPSFHGALSMQNRLGFTLHYSRRGAPSDSLLNPSRGREGNRVILHCGIALPFRADFE